MSGDDRTIDLTGGLGGSPSPPVNGNGNGHPLDTDLGHPRAEGTDGRAVGLDTGVAAGGELDGIEWYPSYDRASVEQHLRELDEERARLEASIADADRRTAEAEATLAAQTADLEAGLGAVVLAARAELARIDRERDEAVAAIRAEAEAEAARVREAASQEAAAVRGAAASLSALAPPSTELHLPSTSPGPVATGPLADWPAPGAEAFPGDGGPRAD